MNIFFLLKRQGEIILSTPSCLKHNFVFYQELCMRYPLSITWDWVQTLSIYTQHTPNIHNNNKRNDPTLEEGNWFPHFIHIYTF